MKPEHQRVRVPLRGSVRSGYEGEMREFLSAIAERRAPSLKPASARRDLEIVLCAYDALERSPEAVSIPPVTVSPPGST